MPAKKSGKWDDLQGFLDQTEPAELVANGHSNDHSNGHQDPKAISNGSQTALSESKQISDQIRIPIPEDTRRSDVLDLDIERPIPPFWGRRSFSISTSKP
jgi:5-methyltetrahydrofolate--homocysteine methyltransferase